ncbi:MAG: hypothetical protein WC979_00925 [Candidatus Pacearchaeota archaeon]|jgi:hypothetical protein|nr:hypothetical protein [Clostridia bacterium]
MAKNTGLPHYKNSTAARNLWEPVFKAYFSVMLTPPPGISDWDLVMENIIKISGMKPNTFPAIAQQSFKGAHRSYIGGKPGENSHDLSLDFEVNLNDSNSMYVYKAIRAWCDLAYNPLTGKMGLKKDYKGGPLIISQYNANGDIFRQITYQTVIPMSAVQGPNDPDFESDEIFKVTDWQLRVDDWEETWL